MCTGLFEAGTPAETTQRWEQGGHQSPGAFSDCVRQEIPQLSRGSQCPSQLLSSRGAGTELCVSSAVPLSPLPDLLPGPGDRPLAQPRCLLWDVGQRQDPESPVFWLGPLPVLAHLTHVCLTAPALGEFVSSLLGLTSLSPATVPEAGLAALGSGPDFVFSGNK